MDMLLGLLYKFRCDSNSFNKKYDIAYCLLHRGAVKTILKQIVTSL